MSTTEFSNRRIQPELTTFHALAEEMAHSFGYTAELTLEGKLAELVRLRVAQVTPCSYCLVLHTRVVLECGVPVEKVAHLASWRESEMFSAAERAALAYTEGLTTYDLKAFQELHDALTEHFNPTEIAELAAVIINMNVWTRLKLAEGATPRFADRNPEPSSSPA
ncbi:carboxymuconolactone decarboxylase family protein [Leifsonia soli]|uniref:AhpD family alkylhydroperoxidase n=1 Tax=Leifsonia soli TaxID=582665 RepID=A0A852T5K1_9MICO|nr:carboxymuconolactone decarboxylase family protein [Leifsonia soli]NYD76095.1 AhpD family alkylhydroperoxidase [Leifsonia soli]